MEKWDIVRSLKVFTVLIFWLRGYGMGICCLMMAGGGEKCALSEGGGGVGVGAGPGAGAGGRKAGGLRKLFQFARW